MINYGISKFNLFFYFIYFFFEKKRFDTDGFHAISSDKFLKRLTNEEFVNKTPSIPTSETQDQQTAILRAPYIKSFHHDLEVKTPRLNSKRFLCSFFFKFDQILI